MARAGMKKKAEARAQVASAEARKALKDGLRAAKDLAAALRAQAKEAGLDERAEELAHRAEEFAQRLADSDAAHRAEELAQRVLETDTAKQVRKNAARYSDEGLERIGGWLSNGKVAEKLHVQPSKRRVPAWLAGLLGLAAGYLIGTMTAPKRGEEFRDDLATGVARLTQDTADSAAPPSEKPLADEVRTRLGEDPRTADLPKLNINVAEGTVFVRGSVPAGVDEDAIRSVVASVPGVRDVDLQVTAAS